LQPGLALRDARMRRRRLRPAHGRMIGGGLSANYDPDFFHAVQHAASRASSSAHIDNHDSAPTRRGLAEAFLHAANNLAARKLLLLRLRHAHVAVLDTNATPARAAADTRSSTTTCVRARATWEGRRPPRHHLLERSHGSDLTARRTSSRSRQVRVEWCSWGTIRLRAHQAAAEQRRVQPGRAPCTSPRPAAGRSAPPVGSSTFTAYAGVGLHFTRVTVNGGRRSSRWSARRRHPRRHHARQGNDRAASAALAGRSGRPAGGSATVSITCVSGPCAADCTCAAGLRRRHASDQTTEACDNHDDAACPGSASRTPAAAIRRRSRASLRSRTPTSGRPPRRPGTTGRRPTFNVDDSRPE